MSADDKPLSDVAPGQRDFLSRWSQRKAEATQKAPVDQEELSADQLPGPSESASTQLTAEQLESLSDEELLIHFDLPDPDTMKQGDDFTAFMKTAVPTRIRNRALRKLWLSNPALANVDMLVDYGEDFTDAATVVPGMMTAYQVGKGIVRKIEDLVDGEESEVTKSDSDDVETHAEEVETHAESGPEDNRPRADADRTEMDEQNRPAETVDATDDESRVLDKPKSDAKAHFGHDDEELAAITPLRRMQFSFDS